MDVRCGQWARMRETVVLMDAGTSLRALHDSLLANLGCGELWCPGGVGSVVALVL